MLQAKGKPQEKAHAKVQELSSKTKTRSADYFMKSRKLLAPMEGVELSHMLVGVFIDSTNTESGVQGGESE